METVVESSLLLEELLREATNEAEKRNIIHDHINKLEEHGLQVTDFSTGLEWMNTTRSLSFKEQLSGKLCILDFFTYCCINCMHILPDLHALEEKHSDTDGLAVVGVHSAKFENEKTSANILSAVLRYNITHAVVNDHPAKMWNDLGIMCWPTLVVVSPNGKVLLSLAGEGHRQTLSDFVSISLSLYKEWGAVKYHPLGIVPVKSSLPTSPLLFPGKLCLNDSGECLVVSDTAHHRVLIVSLEGVVEECIGSGVPGLRDGTFEEARFNSPQGVCYKTGGVIYVADTENHTIREIDLNRKIVVTVVGTGNQGNDMEGGKIETEQEISSPWDVLLCPSIDSVDSDVLIIAMAGTHQLWTYFLKDAKWMKTSYSQATCSRWAGSGQEQNRNNSYPHKAAFAQPSGLTVDHSRQIIYIADSESSSIRSISLKDGAVKAVVGGERDPTNLFSFGDIDGKGIDAKLQHPLAVAVLNEESGEVVVADSYNHKIKIINPSTKICSTLFGSGHAGNVSGSLDIVELNEPGGLCMDVGRGVLYIADTNNHAIKVYSRKEASVSQLPIIFPSRKKDMTDYEVISESYRMAGRNALVIREESLTLGVGSSLTVELDISLEDNAYLTEGAPSAWQITMEGNDINTLMEDSTHGKIQDLNKQPKIELRIPDCLANQEFNVIVECLLYYCTPEGVCKMKGIVFVQNIVVEDTSSTPNNMGIIMQHKLS